jgi:two-component system sensor kinase FixL
VQGQKVQLLMPEPYASEHDGYVARYQRTGEPQAIGRVRTVAARRKNGELFPIELSVTEFAVGSAVRYGAFIRDISDKVRLQEQVVERERLAAIGTTAAKLVHEIGNPLNGMAVTAQLLQRRLDRQREGLDEKVQAAVRALRGEIGRLAGLLQEFRSLSRQQPFAFAPTNLRAVVHEVVTTELPHWAERGVRIKQPQPDELPPVLGDGDKLKQVVLNLCKNAVEAMPEGGTLSLRLHKTQEGLTLEVADTGLGIPEGVNIFEPFVTTKPEGTGLGLAIVQQIVAAHGGSLRYTSALGSGTTFLLTLPLAPAE